LFLWKGIFDPCTLLLTPVPTEQVYLQRNDFIYFGTSLFDVYTEGRIKGRGEKREKYNMDIFKEDKSQ